MAPPTGPRVGVAFLLAQLGAHVSAQFAEQLEGSELTPSLAGILRILRTNPEISQQDLAARIGVVPSRLVAIVDDLEDRGWLTRSRGTVDRRVNRLALTEVGDQAFTELATVARQHESTVTAGLTDPEIRTLRELLTKLADLRGLAPGVHPGYRFGR